MKRFLATAFSGAVGNSGRLLLTFLVFGLFVVVLGLVANLHGILLRSQDERKTPTPLFVGTPQPSALHDPGARAFWPAFHRSSPGRLRSSMVNGVQVITEDWISNASAHEILSYYRSQMAARGWQDVTEETYGLQPEVRDRLSAGEGLLDEKYFDNYRQIMESKLVLHRREWTLHILVEPDRKSIRQQSVQIYAAADPSMEFVLGSLQPNITGSGAASLPDKPLEAVQRSGGQEYRTTMAVTNTAPAVAFKQEIARLGAQGWSPTVVLPNQPARPGYFSWLTRGESYGALSVSPGSSGSGSSITFTQVSPDSKKAK